MLHKLNLLKYFLFVPAVIFIIYLIQLNAQPVSGPGGNYWPLYCKTGGNIKVAIDNQSRLRLFFESSKAPANADFSGLRPGQCSWPDRALNKNELKGYYGEIFAQWECPALMIACLAPVYDSTNHTYVPPIPFLRDPSGKKFKIWLHGEDKYHRILGDTSPKIEMVR